MKKVAIAGASGFIGEYLSSLLQSNGWSVVRIGRSNADATWNDQPSLVRALEGAHAVVNLAGKSVNCRFNDRNVKELISSRVETTRAIGDAIALCKQPPSIWVNASGASIYPETTGKPNSEESSNDGKGTMADVARKWEMALDSSNTPHTKKVALRISLVLGNGGGVYPTFRILTKAFQGGAQGSGSQMMSWIHIHDLCAMILKLIESENPPSIINAAAPQPLSNSQFMRIFRNSLGISLGIGAPAVFIQIGTALLGVDSELVLRGMNVVSSKAKQIGFQFTFPSLDVALEDLNRQC
ncbi:MAG: hypothetical protein RL040_105 [Bacteroidota bacterium]|jgi:uncharacterized protein (TIGR01777 family)